MRVERHEIRVPNDSQWNNKDKLQRQGWFLPLLDLTGYKTEASMGLKVQHMQAKEKLRPEPGSQNFRLPETLMHFPL